MAGSLSGQLTLPVRLSDHATFGNFHAGRNTEIVERLAVIAHGRSAPACIYVWGACGSGKTHLLQATCRTVNETRGRAAYVPLADPALSASVLDECSGLDVVCIDDVERVAGSARMEAQLFSLFERLRERGGQLVVAARVPPRRLGLSMQDLVSRLSGGLVYRLSAMNDADKRLALRSRADRRGFDLSEEVLRYVMRRYARDTHALFAWLDEIDDASLADQRRVTIPFLRDLEARRRAGAQRLEVDD